MGNRPKSISGFVYIWRDRKHKRFYIGSHWGSLDDGYICSSKWMKHAWNRRPQDFKRRILFRSSDRSLLIAEEFRWLSMIDDRDIGDRYYNLNKKQIGHWSADPLKNKSVGEKISAALKGKPNRSSGKFKSGDERGKKTRFSKGHSTHNKGKTLEERYGEDASSVREKLSLAKKGKSFKNAGSFGNRPAWNKGLNRIYINDGKTTKCLYGENPVIPEGWSRGMAKKPINISHCEASY